MTDQEKAKKVIDLYDERVVSAMPVWIFWGEGIVLVRKQAWIDSGIRIAAIVSHSLDLAKPAEPEAGRVSMPTGLYRRMIKNKLSSEDVRTLVVLLCDRIEQLEAAAK